MEQRDILELKKEIIYGPIDSRRLGKSLGINLMPSEYKLCSFNCVYCHYGKTDKITLETENYEGDLPSVEEVNEEVEKVLKSSLRFDYITFSGNGEPTNHPYFPCIVENVIRLRDKYRKDLNIALLSNSSGLLRTGVMRIVRRIDYPFFKLDAGTEETFREVNCPSGGIRFNEIVDALTNLSGIYIQTLFVKGKPDNRTDDELEEYFNIIESIHPEEVHIYSIDRPVESETIEKVPPEELKSICERGERKTGVTFRYFYIP